MIQAIRLRDRIRETTKDTKLHEGATLGASRALVSVIIKLGRDRFQGLRQDAVDNGVVPCAVNIASQVCFRVRVGDLLQAQRGFGHR